MDRKAYEEYKKKEEFLPYQDEIDRSGFLYWQSTLKKPDEMIDNKEVSVFRFKGLNYIGREDITEKVCIFKAYKLRTILAELSQTQNLLVNP